MAVALAPRLLYTSRHTARRHRLEELRRIREEAGLSQAQLARESGVDRATINKIEQGKRSPSIATLESLSRALGVEVADFFPKSQSPLPLDDQQRASGIKVGEAFFVPLREGEEQDTVTIEIHPVWLFEGNEPILRAMRKASPNEEAAMRRELEKTGRVRE